MGDGHPIPARDAKVVRCWSCGWIENLEPGSDAVESGIDHLRECPHADSRLLAPHWTTQRDAASDATFCVAWTPELAAGSSMFPFLTGIEGS